MCVPEIAVRFVHLRAFLFFLLDCGETFLLLISRSGGLSRLTTDEECGQSEQADELKRFHILGLYRVTHQSSLPFAPQSNERR